MIKNVHRSSCKSTRYYNQILIKLELSPTYIRQILSNSIKILPMAAELFHAAGGQTEGQTGTTKLTFAFSQFFERA